MTEAKHPIPRHLRWFSDFATAGRAAARLRSEGYDVRVVYGLGAGFRSGWRLEDAR